MDIALPPLSEYPGIHGILRRSQDHPGMDIALRRLLDRRRLEDAHFQYAILRVAAWYNLKLTDLPLHGATTDTLLRISSIFYKLFMTKYSVQLLSP